MKLEFWNHYNLLLQKWIKCKFEQWLKIILHCYFMTWWLLWFILWYVNISKSRLCDRWQLLIEYALSNTDQVSLKFAKGLKAIEHGFIRKQIEFHAAKDFQIWRNSILINEIVQAIYLIYVMWYKEFTTLFIRIKILFLSQRDKLKAAI